MLEAPSWSTSRGYQRDDVAIRSGYVKGRLHKNMTVTLSVVIAALSVGVMLAAAPSDRPCGGVLLSLDKRAVLDKRQRKPVTILTLAQLPKTSKIAQGFGLDGTFQHTCLSPGGDFLAFTVRGSIHDWVGLFVLKTRQLNELDFFFEGSAGTISWSPNSQFFVVTIVPASGYRTIAVYDTKHEKSVRLLDEYFDMEPQTEAWAPEWTLDGNTLKFRTKRPGKAEAVEYFLVIPPSSQKENILQPKPLAVLLSVCFLIVGLLYHFAKPRHSA